MNLAIYPPTGIGSSSRSDACDVIKAQRIRRAYIEWNGTDSKWTIILSGGQKVSITEKFWNDYSPRGGDYLLTHVDGSYSCSSALMFEIGIGGLKVSGDVQ